MLRVLLHEPQVRSAWTIAFGEWYVREPDTHPLEGAETERAIHCRQAARRVNLGETVTGVWTGPVEVPEDQSDITVTPTHVVFGRRARILAPGCVLSLAILYQFNIWPGRIPNSSAYFLFAGNSQCVANEFPNLDFACDANGFPSGLVIAFGYPHVWLTAAAERLSPLGILNSYRLVWALTLIVALYGARRLFGLFCDSGWVAWSAAGILMLSPIVSNQSGYGPLQLAFALLPCYILVDLWFMRCLDQRRLVIASGALVAIVRTFALFTDGYSFVMSMIPIGLLYVMWGWRRITDAEQRRYVAAGWLAAGASILLAYVLYTRYLGVSAFSPTPLDLFRGQGVDLFALAVPSETGWLADRLGLHHTIEATQAYSDGHNISDVYIGWSLIAAAIGGVAIAFRRRLASKVLVAVGLAGIAAFILALGPSLKVADFRPSLEIRDGVPAVAVYLMTGAEATIPTGLAWIYQNVPGIDTMRALYRWELLVKLALLLFSVVLAAWMIERGRRLLVVVILLVLAAESVPSPSDARRAGTHALATVDMFTREVVVPLAAVVHPGERVLLVNPAPGGTGTNFYLANWLCPLLDVRCYNAGGDKAVALASEAQPAAALGVMFSTENLGTSMEEVFRRNEADVIILVNFDMRAAAYSWPPPPERREEALVAGQVLLVSGDFQFETFEWATVVRPSTAVPDIVS